jgi:hypothetical protein
MALYEKTSRARARRTLVAIALALGVVMAAVNAPGQEKVSPPEPKKAPEDPAWKKEFREKYRLKDGEVVKRIAPPYAKCRSDYLTDRFRAPAGDTSYDEYFTVLRWKGDWAPPELARHTRPVKPELGLPVIRLLDRVADIPPHRIEGSEMLNGSAATGDFVVRDGADPEKLVAELERILRQDCDLKVSFRFKDAEASVYVLSGKYEAKPLEGRMKNEIEVYAAHLVDRESGDGGSDSFEKLLAALESHIGHRVVPEKIEGLPKKVLWHYNVRSPALKDPTRGVDTLAEDTAPDAILANLAAQTGLKVKLENRKVRVLVVERG